MLKIHLLTALGVAGALVGGTASAQEDPQPDQGVTWKDLMGTDSRLRLYGFLRTDAAYDSDRFNDPQLPTWVLSPDSSPNNTNDEFTLHARMTRLGANFSTKAVKGLGDPELSGRLEFDFHGGGSDSRALMRMRVGYLDLDWGAWSLLAGQDWDVVSPLNPVVNNDIVMWYAGNTGDRRPQLTAKHVARMGDDGQLVTEFGVALTGAVGGTAVTGSGLSSGEASGVPMLNARVGYHGKCEQGAWQVGLSGHQAQERFDNGSGEQDFDSSSLNLDFAAPLFSKSLSLSGEYHMGENMKDIRGGIATGVNSAGREIDSKGGWAELKYGLSKHTALYAGYAFEDPDDADLDANAQAKNTVPYVAARWNYDDLRLGFEYLNWTTEYTGGLQDGEAHRVVLWIAYYF